MSSSTSTQLPPPTTDWLFVVAILALVTLLYILHGFWSSREARLTDGRAGRSSKRLDSFGDRGVAALRAVGQDGTQRAFEYYKPEAYGTYTDLSLRDMTREQKEQVRTDKVLYHQLQNIEDYPDVVDFARQRLGELLDQTISKGLCDPAGTILEIRHFSPSALRQHFKAAHTDTASKYEAYLARRKQGGSRELFRDRAHAVRWLQLAGVVKYVDGGWLGNSLNLGLSPITATYSGEALHQPQTVERKAAQLAWQVISEEFGDGDLEKNHVYVYRRLLEQLSNGDGAPAGCELGFDGLADDEGSSRCWTAAIAQQCIGLLASTDDFFPEALGFNMAYETLPYHLLVTSRELRELNIDDYYFALHVTIDNPDSGHAALALEAVERFLLGVRERDGESAMEQMWKRVQAGVTLADGLPTTPSAPKDFPTRRSKSGTVVSTHAYPAPSSPPTDVERRMIQLLARKSGAAEKMHCPSRVLIKGHTIEHWLDPATWSAGKALVFLRALGEKKPWVVRGDCAQSRLVRELEWGGRMFGAFSRQETALVKKWIVSLDHKHQPRPMAVQDTYRTFVGEQAGQGDSRESLPRFTRLARENLLRPGHVEDLETVLHRFSLSQKAPLTLEDLVAQNACAQVSVSDPPVLAALWFTSISLLEHFPLSPSRFATPLGAAVLRILRAQLGLPSLHKSQDVCAGMDSVRDAGDAVAGESMGLWELGIIICRQRGFEVPTNFSILAQALDRDSLTARFCAEFCADMLELRIRPYGQQALILGLTLGFTTHLYSSQAVTAFLAAAERAKLQQVCQDMMAGLKAATETHRDSSPTWWTDFVRGHRRALEEVIASG